MTILFFLFYGTVVCFNRNWLNKFIEYSIIREFVSSISFIKILFFHLLLLYLHSLSIFSVCKAHKKNREAELLKRFIEFWANSFKL